MRSEGRQAAESVSQMPHDQDPYAVQKVGVLGCGITELILCPRLPVWGLTGKVATIVRTTGTMPTSGQLSISQGTTAAPRYLMAHFRLDLQEATRYMQLACNFQRYAPSTAHWDHAWDHAMCVGRRHFSSKVCGAEDLIAGSHLSRSRRRAGCRAGFENVSGNLCNPLQAAHMCRL